MTDTFDDALGPGWQHLGYMSDDGGVLPKKLWATTLSDEEVITWGSEKAKWQAIVGDNASAVDPLACPHCKRDWHPEPLTRDVATMLETHKFRLDYNPDTDESDIVCVGADYCGPNRPPRTTFSHYTYSWPTIVWGGSSQDAMKKAGQQLQQLSESMKIIMGDWAIPTPKIQFWTDEWKLIPDKESCELPDDLPTVEFGPHHWLVTEPVHQSAHLQGQVMAHWADFNRDDFPVPESPGMDFSAYATDEISYPTSGKKDKK